MSAPRGNEYYKLRSKDGRDKIFETPEELINACNEYFEWCLNTPLYEAQIVKGNRIEQSEIPTTNEKGKTEKVKSKTTIPYDIANVPKMRPFTLQGLCNFIDISVEGFKLYEEREDFIGVTTRVRQIIENHQFEGASAGMLNANIIARKLGLADKQEVKADVTNTSIEIDEEKLKQIEQILYPD